MAKTICAYLYHQMFFWKPLGILSVKRHYLNQYWPRLLLPYGTTGHNEFSKDGYWVACQSYINLGGVTLFLYIWVGYIYINDIIMSVIGNHKSLKPQNPQRKQVGYHTVYPKKSAHGFCFAVLCCGYTLTDFPISIRLTSLALWQSNDCPSASKTTLMNMDKYFMWIHYERLHNHNKAKHNKTVCIFLGIYCSPSCHSGCWWSGSHRC